MILCMLTRMVMSLSCHTWHLIIKVLESKVRQTFCAFNVNTVLSEYVYFDISWALWSRLNIKGCSVFRGGACSSPPMALDTSSVRTWVIEQLVRDIQSYSFKIIVESGDWARTHDWKRD
jgi:hypothetical protein